MANGNANIDYDELNRLLELGLTPDGFDSERAWMKARTMMLQYGLTVSALEGSARTTAPNDESDDWAFEFIMPFGKYKGDTLQQISETDSKYIDWLYERAEINSPRLKSALHIVYTAGIPE